MKATETILQAIDTEIAKWNKLKASVHAIFTTAKHRKPATKAVPKGKRTMSAAARKRISEAVKKRWARVHREQKKAAK